GEIALLEEADDAGDDVDPVDRRHPADEVAGCSHLPARRRPHRDRRRRGALRQRGAAASHRNDGTDRGRRGEGATSRSHQTTRTLRIEGPSRSYLKRRFLTPVSSWQSSPAARPGNYSSADSSGSPAPNG